jgi:hypothetical protein
MVKLALSHAARCGGVARSTLLPGEPMPRLGPLSLRGHTLTLYGLALMASLASVWVFEDRRYWMIARIYPFGGGGRKTLVCSRQLKKSRYAAFWLSSQYI